MRWARVPQALGAVAPATELAPEQALGWRRDGHFDRGEAVARRPGDQLSLKRRACGGAGCLREGVARRPGNGRRNGHGRARTGSRHGRSIPPVTPMQTAAGGARTTAGDRLPDLPAPLQRRSATPLRRARHRRFATARRLRPSLTRSSSATASSNRSQSPSGPRRPLPGCNSYGGLAPPREGGHSNPSRYAASHASARWRAAVASPANRALNPASGGASTWARSASRQAARASAKASPESGLNRRAPSPRHRPHPGA